MDYIFTKSREGTIKPIHICKTFDWGDIADALRYMRDGKHIGKIVISSAEPSSVQVPVSLVIYHVCVCTYSLTSSGTQGPTHGYRSSLKA